MPDLTSWDVNRSKLVQGWETTGGPSSTPQLSMMESVYINADIYDHFHLGGEICFFSFRPCTCESKHLGRRDGWSSNSNNNNKTFANKNNNRPDVSSGRSGAQRIFANMEHCKPRSTSAARKGFKSVVFKTHGHAPERPLSTKKPRTGLTKWWECTNEHKAFCMKVRDREIAELKAKNQLTASYRWRHSAKKSAGKRKPWEQIEPGWEIEATRVDDEPLINMSPASLMSIVESRRSNGYYFDQTNKSPLEVTPKEYEECTPSGIPFFGHAKDRLVYVKKYGVHSKVKLRVRPPNQNRKMWPFEQEDAEKVVFNDVCNITTCDERLYIARYYDRHSVCYGHRKLPKAYVCSRAPRLNGNAQPRMRMRCGHCGQAVPTAELFGFENVWPALERPYVCTCELSIYPSERQARKKHRDIPIFNVLEQPAAEVMAELERQEKDVSTRQVTRGTIPHFCHFVSNAPVNPRLSTTKSVGEDPLESPSKTTAEELDKARREFCGTCRRTCHEPIVVRGSAYHYDFTERSTPDPTEQHHFKFEETKWIPESCRPVQRKRSKRRASPAGDSPKGVGSKTGVLPPIEEETCPCGRPPSPFLQKVRNFTDPNRNFGDRVRTKVAQPGEQGVCVTKVRERGRLKSLEISDIPQTVCPVCFDRKKQQTEKRQAAMATKLGRRQSKFARPADTDDDDDDELAEETGHYYPKVRKTVGAIMEKFRPIEEVKQLLRQTGSVAPEMNEDQPRAMKLEEEKRQADALAESNKLRSIAAVAMQAKYLRQAQHVWKKKKKRSASRTMILDTTIHAESENEFDLAILPSTIVHSVDSEKVMKVIQRADLGFYEVWETFTHATGAKKGSFHLHAPVTDDEVEHKQFFMESWQDYADSADFMKEVLVSVPLQQIATNDDVIEATMDFYISFLKFLHYAWNPPGTEAAAEVDILATLDPERAVEFLRMFREAPKCYEDGIFKLDSRKTKEEIELERRWKEFVYTIHPSADANHELIGGPFDPSKQIELFEKFRAFVHIHTLTMSAKTESQISLIEFSTWLAFMQGVWGDGKITPVQHFDQIQKEQEKIVSLWTKHRAELKKAKFKKGEKQGAQDVPSQEELSDEKDEETPVHIPGPGIPLVDWFISKDENVKYLEGAIRNMEKLRDQVEEKKRLNDATASASWQGQASLEGSRSMAAAARQASPERAVSVATTEPATPARPQVLARTGPKWAKSQLVDDGTLSQKLSSGEHLEGSYLSTMQTSGPDLAKALDPKGFKGHMPIHDTKRATPVAYSHHPRMEAVPAIHLQGEAVTGVVDEMQQMIDTFAVAAAGVQETAVLQESGAPAPTRVQQKPTRKGERGQQQSSEPGKGEQTATVAAEFNEVQITEPMYTKGAFVLPVHPEVIRKGERGQQQNAEPGKREQTATVTAEFNEVQITEPMYMEGAFVLPVHPEDLADMNQLKVTERKKIHLRKHGQHQAATMQKKPAPPQAAATAEVPAAAPELATESLKRRTAGSSAPGEGAPEEASARRDRQRLADEPATTAAGAGTLPLTEVKIIEETSIEKAKTKLHDSHIKRMKENRRLKVESKKEKSQKSLMDARSHVQSHELTPAVISTEKSDDPVLVKWNDHINHRKKKLLNVASTLTIDDMRGSTKKGNSSSQYIINLTSPDAVQSTGVGQAVGSSDALLQELMKKDLIDPLLHLGQFARNKRRKQMAWLTAGRSSGDLTPIFKRSGAIVIPTYNMAISLKACRFSLPPQMEMLEKMTPMEYVKDYVTPEPTRRYLFKRIFYKLNHNDKITIEMMKEGVRMCLATYITEADLDKIISLLELTPNMKLSYKLFIGCIALCERMIFPKFAKKVIDINKKDRYDKSHLEMCDFHDFQFRTEHLNIPANLMAVLEIVSSPSWPMSHT